MSCYQECEWQYYTKMHHKKEADFRCCVICKQKEMWVWGYWISLPPFKPTHDAKPAVQYAGQG